MVITLGLFSLVFALASAFCAGRAGGLGKQMQDASAAMIRNSKGAADEPEKLKQVGGAMEEIGEGELAQEYTRWVQRAYAWGAASVIALVVLLVLR